MKIKQIIAREILDSRGNPTVEAKVILENGLYAKASVPSGASTGEHESLEMRDGDMKRFLGTGVLKAVNNVNKKISPALSGQEVTKQRAIDNIMLKLDGTKNKAKLGANAILAVSMAVARAGALSKKQPLYKYLRSVYGLKEKNWKLPIPTMNVINGGRHADNTISTQEFMIIPKANTFSKEVRMGVEVFQMLKKVLKEHKQVTTVGDEGGFAPNIEGPFGYAPSFDEDEIGMEAIMEAIKKSGYRAGKDIYLGLDIAASEMFVEGKGYDFNFKQKNKGKKFKTYQDLLEMYKSWLKKYPIISIEDPLSQDEWSDWQKLTKELGKKVILVGDDLFVTNVERLQKGIDEKVGNAILIKLNQIGTLSETIDAIYLAKKNGYMISVSHRSGETADTFIADLAVAVNSDFIKTGSLSRSERVEKYNRLMEIENELK
ncbi:MAG: Enolase [Parcubacteria group bacterium GW2011_GWC2_39_14]|nr:MAG: Enolase [Parcubacteria group bacterium GW2011_GWC2_39_14]KKR54423.1 MAG: Enolase [Parcubacteria group bacterium GW2011_GWA2_40_23]